MKQIITILFGIMLTTQVFGADGSSGCGPGWYVFKDNSLLSSSLRSTTNGVLVPVVTIGMTVGTSNCTKHSIVKNEKRSLHFTTMNFFELKADIAKGGGEHVAALTSTLGCPQVSQPRAAQQFQEHFQEIYPDGKVNPERALSEIYKVIFTDETLTQQCVFGIS